MEHVPVCRENWPKEEGSFGFQWHITDRCNRRCRHCYQERFDASREPSLQALVAMAEHVFSFFSGEVSVNVTGGEPLVFPGIFDLLAALSRFSNLGELNIITNGTVCDDGVLRGITSLDRLSMMKISLESHEPTVNDAIRGVGHFTAAMENIPRFVATGKPVVLMATLQRANADAVPGICALARSLGVAGVIFERYVPLAQGRDVAQVLRPLEWRAVLEAICRETGSDAEWRDLLPYRAFWVTTNPASGEEPLRGALCNLGRSSMALMPDGSVYPCRRFPHAVAQIPRDPMTVVLDRLATYDPMVVVSRLKGKSCGKCGYEGCVGCRALVAALGGDPLEDDPQCPFTVVTE